MLEGEPSISSSAPKTYIFPCRTDAKVGRNFPKHIELQIGRELRFFCCLLIWIPLLYRQPSACVAQGGVKAEQDNSKCVGLFKYVPSTNITFPADLKKTLFSAAPVLMSPHFAFLRDVWVRNQRASVANRRASSLATNLPTQPLISLLSHPSSYLAKHLPTQPTISLLIQHVAVKVLSKN